MYGGAITVCGRGTPASRRMIGQSVQGGVGYDVVDDETAVDRGRAVLKLSCDGLVPRCYDERCILGGVVVVAATSSASILWKAAVGR